MIPETLKPLAVSIDTLRPYERNPRNGDLGAIKESLEANAQYRPVVVNARDNRILCGNHTYAAAMELEWKEIAATFVDVDDEQAARIVLVDNRTNDLAWNDDALISEILNDLPSLEGTGYDDEALAVITSRLDAPMNLEIADDAASEWIGMPEYEHEDLTAFRTLKVHFRNVKDVNAFAKLVKQRITDKSRSIWFPEAKFEPLRNKRYVDES